MDYDYFTATKFAPSHVREGVAKLNQKVKSLPKNKYKRLVAEVIYSCDSFNKLTTPADVVKVDLMLTALCKWIVQERHREKKK